MLPQSTQWQWGGGGRWHEGNLANASAQPTKFDLPQKNVEGSAEHLCEGKMKAAQQNGRQVDERGEASIGRGQQVDNAPHAKNFCRAPPEGSARRNCMRQKEAGGRSKRAGGKQQEAQSKARSKELGARR